MSEDVVVQQETAQEPEEMGVLQRIIGIYFSPSKTFEYLRAKPTWLVPFIIVCVMAVVSSYLVRDIAIQEQVERVQMSEQLTEEQKDIYLERIEAASSGWQSYIQIVATPVVICIAFLVVSAIFLFFGNTLFGGQASFKQMLSTYAHAGLVIIPATIVKIPIMLAQGTTQVQTSLAVVLSSDAQQSILYKILSKFELFVIWEVILLVIGMSVMYRFTRGKSATLVMILWGIWIVVSITLGSLFGGLGLG